MVLQGTVTNVTNFGAFVDIGVHQDGLIHVSELSDQFITDPSTAVSVGDVLSVRVLDVDAQRKRISLSAKSQSRAGGSASGNQAQRQTAGAQQPQRGNSGGQRPSTSNGPAASSRPAAKPAQPAQSYSMGDLLSKFGKK